MWGKAVTIGIGLIVVTGAGFLIASQNSEAPVEEAPEVAPALAEQITPTQTPSSAPAASQAPTIDNLSTAEKTTTVAPPPSPPPSPPSPAAPAPAVGAPKSASTLNTSSIPAGLEGLWKAAKKIVLDKATKMVIREENIADYYAFYNSYKGNLKCYHVEIVGGEPLCSGGYEPFTMRSDGSIVEAGDIQTDRFTGGTLEAVYELPTTIERHLYTKISSLPAPELKD